jgi:outer membrane protein OmpA-like peptidoglycan-associated protein
MKHFKLFLTILLGGLCTSALAQEEEKGSLLLAPMDVFVPHWQVGAEVGAGYDLGEAKFFDLITPTFQVTGAYHFNEFLAARLAVSGMFSKNQYSFPREKYSWNFVQPVVDIKLDLGSLIFGWNPENKFSTYIFAGGGLNFSFNNDDAVEADKKWGVDFQKLWDGHRFNPVVRGGIGAEYWFSDKAAITLEGNANMLPDHYNSKIGKNDNRDWRFNAMIGLRYRLGQHKRKTEPLYAQAIAQQEVQPVVVEPEPVVEKPKITKDQSELTVYIRFTINKSVIRASELEKLTKLITFLRENPESHVLLTGYADRETGNPQINERLSRERADAVGAFLQQRGISEERIHKDHKGDRIQPFDFPAENRVCISIVLNPKYL